MIHRDVGKSFEVTSYVGSDIGQYSTEGDRPPRSAKFVVAINYDGYDFSQYWLSTTWDRRGWVLWATSEDVDLGKMYATLAWGEQYRGISPVRAAEELLRQVWLDEIRFDEYHDPCLFVDSEGLLTETDIRRIEGSLPSRTDDQPAS